MDFHPRQTGWNMIRLSRCLVIGVTIVSVGGSLACHHRQASVAGAASPEGLIKLGPTAHRYFADMDSGAVGTEIPRSSVPHDLVSAAATVLRIDDGEQRCVRQFELHGGFAFVYVAGCAGSPRPEPIHIVLAVFSARSKVLQKWSDPPTDILELLCPGARDDAGTSLGGAARQCHLP